MHMRHLPGVRDEWPRADWTLEGAKEGWLIVTPWTVELEFNARLPVQCGAVRCGLGVLIM